MIVRRLKALVAWVVAGFDRAFGARARQRVRAEHAAVAATTAPHPSPAGRNWLEDGRRLRGRPAPRPAPARPANEVLRQVLRDPHWTSAFEAGRLARPLHPLHPLEERTTLEPLRLSPHLSAAPSDSAREAANGEDMVEEQRRLLLIRELVRRGLYNEGFKPGHIPEQYRPRPTPPGATPGEPPLI